MDISEIVTKKQNKMELNNEEINYFVKGYTIGDIDDNQAADLIRAIYSNGMTYREITDLTLAMAYSGEVLDLSKLGTNVVDKHSTGGIGDKITLILMPVIAALGIPVAKMSGRGLGYTGGTVDKLESIPGYNTQIAVDEFIENVKSIGISLIGQTLNLAPADKKIYALRDAIGCVESIPLIASSIMSKKIAAGANKIVLEVTVGNGAFMKNIDDARKLSETMINIGKLANKEVVCILTNMDEPLGYSIGNSLEVIEAAEALQGDIEDDVKEVVLELGSYMIKLAGCGDNIEDNKKRILDCLESGDAYMKFLELVENQGGDVSYINDVSKFENAKYILPILSKKTGYIKKINAEKLGEISCKLGAGRAKIDDIIDNQVGLIINKKIGDMIEEGEMLAIINENDEDKLNNAKKELFDCFEICDEFVEKPKVILEIIK
jgi:pyrimidine-nucleoside phosphorylase